MAMFAVKKALHGASVRVSKMFAGLMPDRVPMTFVGDGSSRELCETLAQMGLSKLLIVTDAMLVQIGLVAKISASLDELGVAWAVYDGVEPDPTFTHVQEGLAKFRAEQCDAILAVGGGSSMDAAKVIAAMATNDKPLEKLEGWFKVSNPTAPLFAIPTTAGTGSEATVAAVVSDPVSHTKKFVVDPKLLPSIAALDPGLMEGLPPPITAATGMDALTHAVESYVAKTASVQTDVYATAAVRLIFKQLRTACREGTNMEARKGMALASFYAGVAFTRTSVGYVHAIAHTFGAYYGTPHGVANAITLPHVLDFSEEAARSRLAELATVIGIDSGSEAERARRFIDAVRELTRDIGIPETLDALRRDDITKIATQALAEAHLNYPVPRYMRQEECETLIERIAT